LPQVLDKSKTCEHIGSESENSLPSNLPSEAAKAPDLTEIVKAWEYLDKSIKQAILAIVRHKL
jgi:hypothetical protein